MTQNIITSTLETPIGSMIAGANNDGICLFEFSDRDILNSQYETLCKFLKAKLISGENQHIEKLRIQIAEYFKGIRKTFDCPLIMAGTDFQIKIWNELLKIPYGSTRSYKQQSEALKNPLAIRAIAHANAMNRIAIIIPCHRIIGSNGQLTGYGGGLWRKQWLLNHEAKFSGTLQRNLFT